MKHKGARSGPSEPRMSTPIKDMITAAARVVSPTKKSLGRKTKLSLHKNQGVKSQNFIPSVRLNEVISPNDSSDFQDSGSTNTRKRLPRYKYYDNKKTLDCIVNKAGDVAPARKALGCALNTADQVLLGPDAESSKHVKDSPAVVLLEKFDHITDMLQHYNFEMQSASAKPDGLSKHVWNRDLKLAAAPASQNEALKRKHNILLKSDPEMEEAWDSDRAPYGTDVIKLTVSDAVLNVSRDGTSESDTIVEVTKNGTSECSSVAMASKNNTTSAGALSLTVSSGSCEGLQSSREEVQDGREESGESYLEGSLSTTQHTCPTCGQLFPRGCFVKHMKVCLREQFRWKHQVLSEGGTGDKKQVMSVKGEALNADYVFCPLCQKDITHLNSHRRIIHTNKCFDELEQKKQEEAMNQKALQAARMQVLNCPMCGKILRTQQSRKNHLKKCSAKLEVSTEQLLSLIKKQKEEHEAKLAAGILSHIHRPAEKNQMGYLGQGVRKTSAPKSKLEEDTQLALALSSSLYPCLTTATTSFKSGHKKRKIEINKDDYLLYTLNSSQAASRIANRVSDFLSQEMEEEENFFMLPAVDKNHLQHLCIKRLVLSQTEESEQKSLWKMTSLSVEKTSGGKDNPQELFYVSELMPPVEISTLAAGSKLCGISNIASCHNSSESQTPGPRDNRTEEKGAENVPLTQTAFMLADMAAEAESISQNSSCYEQSQGSEEDEDMAADDLISDFLSLVNQPAYSDAKIVVSGGQELHVHRLILSIRCPRLLQWVQDGSGIASLSAWSADSVLALLRYLYGGLTNIDDRLLASTLDLAERLDVMRLKDVCQRRLWRSQQMADVCQGLSHPIECSGRAQRDDSSVQRGVQRDDSSVQRDDSSVQRYDKNMQRDEQRDDNSVQRDDSSVQRDEEVGIKDTKSVIRYGKTLLNERSHITNSETNFKRERTPLKKDKPIIKDNKSPIKGDKTLVGKSIVVLSKTQTSLKEGRSTPKEAETMVKETTRQDRTALKVKLSPTGNTTMLLGSNKNSPQSAIVSFVSEVNSCSASESVKTIPGSYFEKTEPPRTLRDEELSSDNDDDAQVLVMKEEDSFNGGSCLRGTTANLTRDVTPPSDRQKDCSNHPSTAATSSVKYLHSSEIFCHPERKDVESIEISDDDLFSDEDSDASVLSSTPQVSLGKAAVWREKILVASSNTCGTSYNQSLSQPLLNRGKVSESTSCNQLLFQSPLNRGKVSESISKSPSKCSLEKRKHSPDHWLTDSDEQTLQSVNFLKFSNLSKRQRTSNRSSHPERATKGRVIKKKVFKEARIRTSDFENLNKNVLDTECTSSLKPVSTLQHSRQPPAADASKQDNISLDSDALQYNEGPTLPSEKNPKSHCGAMLLQQKKSRAEEFHEVPDRLVSTSCDFSSCRKQAIKPALTSADVCSSPQVQCHHDSSCIVSPSQAHSISDDFGDSRRQNVKRVLDTENWAVDEKTVESDSDLEIVDGCPGEVSSPKFHMSGQPKQYDKTEASPTACEPSLAAFEQDSYSMPDDGVWEGFDDVEMHNPDLEIIDTYLSSSSVLDSLENKNNAMGCVVRSGSVKMADPLLECVMSPVKMVDSPVRKHHQNQLSRPAIGYNHCEASLNSSVRGKCSSPANLSGSLPDLHTRVGAHVIDADVAAYDNSFLWSEENAPELIVSKEILPASQCSQKTVKPFHGLPQKTPSKRLKKGQHVWVPPSPFTPMPDYDRMTTPQLKAEVQKIGVRPLGKKKMRCLLKDIYEKTHQYETDPEIDEDVVVADLGTETSKPGRCSQPLHRTGNHNVRALQKTSHRQTKSQPLKTKSKGKTRGVDRELHTLTETAEVESEEVAIVRHGHSSGDTVISPVKRRGVVPAAGGRERALSECSSSPDKNALSSSQASDISEQPDMNVFEEADAEDDDVALSQQVSTADTEEMIMNYIRGRPDLHEQVLTYEPLDLVVLRDDLKAAGIRCGQQKLLDILNAKCITFTNKNLGCWQRNTRGKWDKSKKPKAKNNS